MIKVSFFQRRCCCRRCHLLIVRYYFISRYRSSVSRWFLARLIGVSLSLVSCFPYWFLLCRNFVIQYDFVAVLFLFSSIDSSGEFLHIAGEREHRVFSRNGLEEREKQQQLFASPIKSDRSGISRFEEKNHRREWGASWCGDSMVINVLKHRTVLLSKFVSRGWSCLLSLVTLFAF